MDVHNPNFVLGLSLFGFGVAAFVVFGKWYTGLPFIFLGAHRLYVAYVESTKGEPSG